ncbi:MAG: hypothetical protein GX088_08485 [Clostridia bacterium]|nr:hypothetical protein [Clostridia bacterium]
MSDEALWSRIISELSSSGEELQTRTELWFRTTAKRDSLFVDRAAENILSSNLSKPRIITKKDFLFVYSYYDRWVNGEKGVRKEVSMKSRNTTYIFALIERFAD